MSSIDNILSNDFIYPYKDKPTPMSNYGLGEFVYKRTYSRVKPSIVKKDDGTTETVYGDDYEEWYETIERVVNGAFKIKKKHYLKNNIEWNDDKERDYAEKMYDKLFNVKFLPGGRSLWAMGTKITDEKGLFTALNNCAGCSTAFNKENPGKPFEFLFDACMLGVGVGFDTKGTDIPLFMPLDETEEYVVEDSREGWVNALHQLLISYFTENKKRVIFNYEKIRPAGQLLKTFGGTSSGYGPLKKSFDMITDLLDKAVRDGNKYMTSKLIVSVMNIICLAVISGNVRRSATIALGEYDDNEFIELKDYEKNPERMSYGWLSNNSIDAKIGMDYSKVAEGIKLNGEPGLIWLENVKKYSRMNGNADWKDKDSVICNPCTAHDTLLTINDNNEIKKIVIGEHVGEIVNVWNGNKWTPAEVKLTGHNRNIYHCVFSDGNYLDCTENHKFILSNGDRKELKDLSFDDQLMNSNLNEFDQTNLHMVSKEFKELAENVYCVTTLDDSHAAVFNNILTGNCGEQSLHNFELCNLVEIFINRSDSYEDFMDTLKYAFMYAKIVSLCETQWEDTNKVIRNNRRVGCSLTGIVNFVQDKGIEALRKYTTSGYDYLKTYDKELSNEMKINESIKITCIKPSGTISLLVPGTCPGIHYPLSKYYIRRVRVNINHKKLLDSMSAKGYKIEKSETEPNTMIINFPIDIKSNRCISDVSMWEQLEMSAKLSEWWTDNQVSCTVMFDPRTEGQDIKYALDLYQYRLKGISFLPTFKNLKPLEDPKVQKYPQMPFEEITKSEYELMCKNIKDGKINIDTNEQEEEMYCTTDTCIMRSVKKSKDTKVIFMNGLAGSGKSFIAKKLMTYIKNLGLTCEIISKDDFRYIDGKYIFDREYEKVVEEKYFNKLQEVLDERLNYLILDNTHIGNDFVNKTFQYLIGYKMTMISIAPFNDLNKHIELNIHIGEKDSGRLKYQKNNWEINYPLYQLHKVLYERKNDENFDNEMIEKIIDDTISFFKK